SNPGVVAWRESSPEAAPESATYNMVRHTDDASPALAWAGAVMLALFVCVTVRARRPASAARPHQPSGIKVLRPTPSPAAPSYLGLTSRGGPARGLYGSSPSSEEKSKSGRRGGARR
ncbi:MAG TPA: hypothetical protein VK988_13770, partial [Acidimicrobiales bacterium]|nr:hypothetical protein [Acidimicrobiales bacterium]